MNNKKGYGIKCHDSFDGSSQMKSGFPSLKAGCVTKLKIKKATVDRYQAVRRFYHRVIDGIATMPYGAGWIKDVYPAPEFLQESINNGELYVAMEDENIVAAMVLNHIGNDGYKEYNCLQKQRNLRSPLFMHLE